MNTAFLSPTHGHSSVRRFILPLIPVLIAFAVLPVARALTPSPDGGYPGFNTAEGQNALLNLDTSTGVANTAVGWLSLQGSVNTSFNTAVGAGTLLFNTADENTAIGAGALLNNTTGPVNTAIGTSALASNTEGSANTATGHSALLFNTTGFNNTALGAGALLENTDGVQNTANGNLALRNNTSGIDNTACGAFALLGNTIGDGNTATGFSALESNTEGSDNTAYGIAALASNTTGSNNTALGAQAGAGVTTADNVICIGATGADVSNSCYIGNIYGAKISKNAAFVFVDADGKVGTGPVDANGNKVTLPGPQTMLNELHKQQRRIAELEATVSQQQKQIQALTAGLQKVSAQLELSKAAPQTVLNNQ